MATCRDHEELLTLHAAGALEPDEEARVLAHLESCATCRAELEAHRDVLSLAALPPPSAREEAVLAALPRTTVGVWRRAQVKQAARMWTAGALLAAAAAVLLALGPVVLRHAATPPRQASQEVEASSPTSEDTSSALEQWALADPLAEALEQTDATSEEPEDGAEPYEPELEDFLSNPNPGDTL